MNETRWRVKQCDCGGWQVVRPNNDPDDCEWFENDGCEHYDVTFYAAINYAQREAFRDFAHTIVNSGIDDDENYRQTAEAWCQLKDMLARYPYGLF